MKMLSDAGTLSEEKYEEIVDKVIKYYASSKEIAAKEIPEVRKFLMSQWKGIESQLEGAGEDAVDAVKSVQKKAMKAVKRSLRNNHEEGPPIFCGPLLARQAGRDP
jgi:ElaB/YqjD/DUF883 family membrane-anchored ribosome-binding protein